jgi:hypothetical protein
MRKHKNNRIQISFTFDQELLEHIKEKAKGHNLTLNDYIEILVRRDIWNIPNAETIAAIEEAHSVVKLETITDIEKFMDSI